jgi:adenylate kinase family enzyme
VRIVLLGTAGAGKSRLAREIAGRTGAARICLDSIWPRFGGDVAAFRDAIARLHAGEAWISDGNFAKATFDLRLPRATQIVWLEPPRIVCAARAVTRVLHGHDPDHPLSRLPEVLGFIARFDRINRPLIEGQRLAHGPDVPVVRLKSRSDVQAFVSATAAA